MMQQLPEGVGLRARVAQLTLDNTGKIVAVGVATVVLAPVVLPLIRPLFKASLKTGVLAFEKIKGSGASQLCNEYLQPVQELSNTVSFPLHALSEIS